MLLLLALSAFSQMDEKCARLPADAKWLPPLQTMMPVPTKPAGRDTLHGASLVALN
jgi:hypothetical protein